MKNLILVLLLISVSLLGHSENSSSQIAEKTSETVAAVEKSTQEVNATVVYFTEKLEELAKSLKVPAEHVYKVLVKQQTASAVVDLIIILFLFSISIGLFLWLKATIANKNKKYRLTHPDDYDVKKDPEYNRYDFDYYETWVIGWVVCAILSLAGLITLVFLGSGIFTGIFNPEYGAIKEIMRLF